MVIGEKLDCHFKLTLEETEGAIKNGQSRDTDNIGHTRRRQTNERCNG